MKDYLITRNGIEPLTETQSAIWKAIDKLSREIWINKNKQALIKRRKSHKKNKRLKQALEWEETNGDSDFFRFRGSNIDN